MFHLFLQRKFSPLYEYVSLHYTLLLPYISKVKKVIWLNKQKKKNQF